MPSYPAIPPYKFDTRSKWNPLRLFSRKPTYEEAVKYYQPTFFQCEYLSAIRYYVQRISQPQVMLACVHCRSTYARFSARNT